VKKRTTNPSYTIAPIVNGTEPDHYLRVVMQNIPAPVAMFDRNMCYRTASNRWKQDHSLSGDIAGLGCYDHLPLYPNVGKSSIGKVWRAWPYFLQSLVEYKDS
jgi:hypothetical protein